MSLILNDKCRQNLDNALGQKLASFDRQQRTTPMSTV